jgi:hypothetical protein
VVAVAWGLLLMLAAQLTRRFTSVGTTAWRPSRLAAGVTVTVLGLIATSLLSFAVFVGFFVIGLTAVVVCAGAAGAVALVARKPGADEVTSVVAH